MRAGIFAKTFVGTAPLEVFSAAKRAGFDLVQYNWACSGLDSLPERIDAAGAQAVRAAARETGVEVAAVSATYNMIHPDPAARLKGRQAFAAIAASARDIGAELVTVCTGSRDAQDQWRHHPGNATPAAWDDMRREFGFLLEIAETRDVLIGVEPELANVVSSAAQARRLLDDFAGGRLRIVLDPANLFEVETPARRAAVIEEAAALLADHLAMAHAKDRDLAGAFVAAGRGVIDFSHFLRVLQRVGFDGPLLTHGLSAGEAPAVAAFLRRQLACTP